LRGLAIADPVGHLADREAPADEHVGRPLHAHAGQMVAERGVADLGVGALELAAGRGDAARDVVERELGGELVLDDGDRILVQAGAMPDGCGSLCRHASDTPTPRSRMSNGTAPSHLGASALLAASRGAR
jgi:hypothetical protein